MLPKRNLRPTTIQASVAAKTRILSGGSISAGSSTMSSARSSIKPCADKVEEKENMIPGIGLPSVKRSFAEAEFEWEDLDLEDEGDPLMVSEYAADIFAYMLELEVALCKYLVWFYNLFLIEKYYAWKCHGATAGT